MRKHTVYLKVVFCCANTVAWHLPGPWSAVIMRHISINSLAYAGSLVMRNTIINLVNCLISTCWSNDNKWGWNAKKKFLTYFLWNHNSPRTPPTPMFSCKKRYIWGKYRHKLNLITCQWFGVQGLKDLHPSSAKDRRFRCREWVAMFIRVRTLLSV